MFDRAPQLYDAFYDAAGKDYAAEARFVLDLVRARVPEARDLLDVACGTGRHIEHLTPELRCVGVDINETLLEVARSRCPGVRFEVGDMLRFALGQRFDVVMCLFSSVGYARTAHGLEQAVLRMAAHLRPGGVLIVEPSFRPDVWRTDHIGALFVDRPDVKAARIGKSAREGDVAVLHLYYLIGTDGDVTCVEERHELGLFAWEQYRRVFARAGLDLEIDEQGPYGRGLLIGTTSRPSGPVASVEMPL